MQTELLENETPELQLVDPPANEATMPRADAVAIFADYQTKVAALDETAGNLKVTKTTDTLGQKMAREARLSYRAIRLEVDKARVGLVDGMTKEVRRINSNAKQVIDHCEAKEKMLLEQEQFIERETARLENEARTTRAAEIAPFLNGPLTVDLGKITEEDYQKMLADAKDLHELRERRKREAEEAAAKKAADEKAEQDRIKAENDKLKAEAAQKEADRLAAEEAARVERAAIKAKADAELADANRKAAKAKAVADDAAKKAADALAAAARETKRLKDIADQKEKEAAAEQARKDQEERDAQAARDEAARKAAAAPDREKLLAFAEQIRAMGIPVLSPAAQKVQADVAAKLEGFANWIVKQADAL